MTKTAESMLAEPLDDLTVVDYLKQNPAFLIQNNELLEVLEVQQGVTGATSLLERQISVLRGKNKHLEDQLDNLIVAARSNASHPCIDEELARAGCAKCQKICGIAVLPQSERDVHKPLLPKDKAEEFYEIYGNSLLLAMGLASISSTSIAPELASGLTMGSNTAPMYPWR